MHNKNGLLIINLEINEIKNKIEEKKTRREKSEKIEKSKIKV